MTGSQFPARRFRGVPLATVGALIILFAAGCMREPGSGFDRWVRTHETVIFATPHDTALLEALGGAGGGYDHVHRIAVLSLDTIRRYGADDAQLAFRVRHEEAHAWILDTGAWRLMPGPGFAVRQEQAAQCAARVLTGTIPTHLGGETDRLGYWQCPEPYLSRMRAAMTLAGVAS